MDGEALPSSGMPDPRDFADYASYLVEWCAAQPARSPTEKVKELAGFAGCSATQMHYVLRRARQLGAAQGRALTRCLDLSAEAADHLIGLFELPELPTRLARARREALLSDMAAGQGRVWGTPNALVDERPHDAAVLGGIAAAAAVFEGDLPSLHQLLDAAVPPVSVATLEAALAGAAQGERLAPRLARLPSPSLNPAAGAWAHQGLLSFASDALLRLGQAERDVRAFTTSLDEEGFVALEAIDRRVEADLVALAEDAELRVPTTVSAVLTQRLTVAGPYPAGASAGELRWREDTVALPPIAAAPAPAPIDPDRRALALPHPAGSTSFPAYLAAWRAAARAVGLPWSDRWLATQTGLPPSTLHDLASGATRFTSDYASCFYKPLRLEKDPLGQMALAGMALVAAPDDLRQKARTIHHLTGLLPSGGTPPAASDAHFLQSQWYVQVICALATLDGFRAHPGYVCRLLGGRIDWAAAEAALKMLGRLRLLCRDDHGRAVVVEPSHRVEGPHQSVAQFELHDGLLTLNREELGVRSRDLHVNAWLLAHPDAADRRLKRIIEQWDADVRAVLADAERRRKSGALLDRVVVVTRQLFPVFRKLNPDRRLKRRARKRT